MEKPTSYPNGTIKNWGRYDVKSIAFHEIGHCVGLSHTPKQTFYESCVMYPGAIRTLANPAPNDESDLREIYNKILAKSLQNNRALSSEFEIISDEMYETEILIITDYAPIQTEMMDDFSDFVIHGKVREILPALWNTPDGQAPSSEDSDYYIFHDVIIEIDDVYKGKLNNEQNEIHVRKIGGVIENTRCRTMTPDYQKGQEVILFLNKDTIPLTSKNEPEHYFELNEQGQIYVKSNGVAMNALGETVDIQKDILSLFATAN
ncbi:hypothetical protein [Methanolapillus ohkumae]|uniref:Peptidase M10 metallopeptidase domain-containing protein n=1 Tax=Methanolapillus ohkumae TaxID=3028298 RepID=A0AA97A6U6_9EURY|nr:hypothetical protein MsAm2_14560 [Methanosarcinaceae archaeon Am2]